MRKITVGLAALLLTTQQPQNPGYDWFYPQGSRPIGISNKVQNSALYVYDKAPRELALCMLGNADTSIRIEDVLIAPVIYSSPDSSSFDLSYCYCFRNYLGMMHNHNNGICLASPTDMRRFASDERAVLEAIVCGTNPDSGSVRFYLAVKTDEQK